MGALLDCGGNTFVKSLKQSGEFWGASGLGARERSIGGGAATLEMMDYQQSYSNPVDVLTRLHPCQQTTEMSGNGNVFHV
ncbi:hypothetical protein EXN66_Car019801 [Channa argus]|uniref:Uncharacterized protein n=1 Tax=Channa argus TaxID=215402 RepID=A0A6G1QP95_CHAAH|nr:hypothetical protein EXN66_Car019801 [Channa argus]